MHDIISEDILACGGSSSFWDGFRLWLRQDSNNETKASACCSIDPVSLNAYYYVLFLLFTFICIIYCSYYNVI